MAGTKRQQAIRKALRAQAPGIPLSDAEAVLALAERRSMKDLPPSTALWLALGSHVRHVHTDYERLLAEGYERDAARFFVADETDDVLTGWGCQRSVVDDEEAGETDDASDEAAPTRVRRAAANRDMTGLLTATLRKDTTMRIASLFRYPVKGLSPERLTRATLETGGFSGDRLFAVENGPSGFDPAAPVHQPKIKYLMLMRNESLARLRTRYDDASHTLSIRQDEREAVRADVRTAEGQSAIGRFFAGYMPSELRGEPRWLAAPDGYRFMDSRSGFLSIINLASVADLADRIGRPVDPLRFRGNVMVEDLPAWAEFGLVGTEIAAPSGLRLRVIKRIERCAATNVDPQTGARDLQIPKALMTHYGHVDCGIYCEILAGGSLSEGEALSAAAPG